MEFRETETVELKSVAQEGVVKELVAFVNCNGGTVYIASRMTEPFLALRIPMLAPCKSPTRQGIL